ncbi:MAG: response regulator [Actinobacteria bacterium]|nr:response regulator [Actinomycetota bacterium]
MSTAKIDILLVDDDLADRRLVKSALLKSSQTMEFVVQTAASLAEALKLMAKTRFDLVLLDLMLPDSQGLQTVDEICLSSPHIPVVVLADLADEDMAARAIKMGAGDYLIKDGHFQSLLTRTVCDALEARTTEQPFRRAKEQTASVP